MSLSSSPPLALSPSDCAPLPTVSLGHLRLHAVFDRQVVAHVISQILAGQGGWVITPNLDHARRFRRDAHFAAFFAQADLVVADGMPLVWASRLQGTPLPQRVAGSSLIWTLSEAAGRERRSIFLLGGDHGTAEAAGKVLAARYPGLRIAGFACPPVGFEREELLMQGLRAQLIASAPDIVFVALGSPKQECLIAALKTALPSAWWLGVGISFSFVCGTVRRAPKWMQRCGLEWVHRLVQEPRRLAKRYLVDDLPFAFVLFAGAIGHRLRTNQRRRGFTTEDTEHTEKR